MLVHGVKRKSYYSTAINEMIAVMIEIVFIYDSVANQGMSSVNKLNRMGFFMFEKCRFMIEKLLDVQCGRKGG